MTLSKNSLTDTTPKWAAIDFVFKRCGLSIWNHDTAISRRQIRKVAVDFTVWFFVQGTGELIDRKGRIYPLRSGVCLCIYPGMEFEARQIGTDPLGDLYFHFDVFRSKRRLRSAQWPACPFYIEVLDAAFYERSFRRVLELFNRQYLPGYRAEDNAILEAQYLLKSLLLGLIRSDKEDLRTEASGVERHHRRMVFAALSALYENPAQFRSVDDLAKACGYSISWFRTLCLKLTGEKPINILIKARVEHAKKHLTHSDKTIGEIAEMLGYENIYYFSRQFRAVVGMTASNYRTQYSKSDYDSANQRRTNSRIHSEWH